MRDDCEYIVEITFVVSFKIKLYNKCGRDEEIVRYRDGFSLFRACSYIQGMHDLFLYGLAYLCYLFMPCIKTPIFN